MTAGLPVPSTWHAGFDTEKPHVAQQVLQFDSKEEAQLAWKGRKELALLSTSLLRVQARRQHHPGVGRWPSQRAIARDVEQAVQRGEILLGESRPASDEVLVLLPTGDTVDGTRSIQLTWERDEEMLEPHYLFENTEGILTSVSFVLQHKYSLVATFESRESATAARQQLGALCPHARLLRTPVINVNYGSLGEVLTKLVDDAVRDHELREVPCLFFFLFLFFLFIYPRVVYNVWHTCITPDQCSADRRGRSRCVV